MNTIIVDDDDDYDDGKGYFLFTRIPLRFSPPSPLSLFSFPGVEDRLLLGRCFAHMIKQRQQHGYVSLFLLNNERSFVVVVVVIIVINSISFPFFSVIVFGRRKTEEVTER
jgi:hypothetical protein